VSEDRVKDWAGEVPVDRVKGRTIKWSSKSRGRENLSIELELGIGDDRYPPGQVTYDTPEITDLSKTSTLKDKFMSDPKFDFTLEEYVHGPPAPNVHVGLFTMNR
jgi:hypothetical protein